MTADYDRAQRATADLIDIREIVGAWIRQPDLSCAFVAQIDFAITLVDEGHLNEAHVSVATIKAGLHAVNAQKPKASAP